MTSLLFFWFSLICSSISIVVYQFFGKLIFPDSLSAFFLLGGSLCLFPLFRIVQKDSEIYFSKYQQIILIPVPVILTVITGLFFHTESLPFVLTALTFLTLFCIFEARVFFIFAFLLLVETILFLLVDKNPISEKLSIFVYYSLCLGVLFSLIQPWIYRQIQKYIPKSKDIPYMLDGYMSELRFFARLFSRILPLLFLLLLIISETRFSTMIIFDSRFLMTLSVFFILTQTVEKKKWKYDIFLEYLLITLGSVLLFFALPFSFPIVLLLIFFWVISSVFLMYRGEYVKKLAYRFFSI